ncbi:MAG: PAS domain-containing sensor histidine kinase [Chloroflexota bacterium]
MTNLTVTLADITERLPTGYLIFDRQFMLTDINRSAESFLEQLPDEPIGQHISIVLAAYPTLPVLFQRSLLVQQTFVADVQTNGHMLEVTYQPIFANDEARTYRGSIVFLHDVTQRKNSERTISQLAMEKNRLLAQREQQNGRLRYLSGRLVDLQERERKHIAREIHDETGQTLSALLVGLHLLKDEAQQGDFQRIAQLKQQVDEIMLRLHQLAVELLPPSLDKIGFADSLRQLVAQFSQRTSLPVELNIFGDVVTDMTPKMALALYRIVQEALNNVLRHASATSAEVLLKRHVNTITLSIEDNGCGFDPAHIEGRRLGVLGMRTRIEELGGTFQLASEIGHGTTITIECPLANNQDASEK